MSSGNATRYRAPVSDLVIGCALAAAAAAILNATYHLLDWFGFAVYAGTVIAVRAVATWLTSLRSGLDVTPDGFVVRTAFRSRTVPWREVQDVEEVRRPWGRHLAIRTRGATLRPDAPRVYWPSSPRRFEKAVAEILAAWRRA